MNTVKTCLSEKKKKKKKKKVEARMKNENLMLHDNKGRRKYCQGQLKMNFGEIKMRGGDDVAHRYL